MSRIRIVIHTVLMTIEIYEINIKFYNSIMSHWNDIVGHDWAVDMLSKAIELDRLVHAYLITGPSQVGKATLARTFAQALNCTSPEQVDRPCGVCRSCTLIGTGRHPDVFVVKGEQGRRGKRTLKIDQIRELQKALNLTAAEARYKVAILDGFDNANANASNAFLKTLEEPPSYAVLILTALDPDLLLPTVPSRCQRVALRPVQTDLIREELERHMGVDKELSRKLAHLADGRIGWAIEAAKHPSLLVERSSRLALLHEALAKSRVGRFEIAAGLSRNPDDLMKLLRTWLSWWRDLAIVSIGGMQTTIAVNIDDAPTIQRLAVDWNTQEVVRSLRQTDEAIWQLEHNANTRLVVENLLLKYPLDQLANDLVQEAATG